MGFIFHATGNIEYYIIELEDNKYGTTVTLPSVVTVDGEGEATLTWSVDNEKFGKVEENVLTGIFDNADDGELEIKLSFKVEYKDETRTGNIAIDLAFEFDELIPRVEFVEKNTVLASGESGFYLYQCGKTVMQKHAQTFSGEAKSIFVTEDSIGIITKNPEIAKEGKTVDKYKVQIYRFSGTRAGGFTFDFDYKEVSASGKDIIFYNDQECEIYSYRGRKKFQHVFDRNIESVLPGNESGEYILLDQQKVQTITLK